MFSSSDEVLEAKRISNKDRPSSLLSNSVYM